MKPCIRFRVESRSPIVSYKDGFNTEDDSQLQGGIINIAKPFKFNRYKRPGPVDQLIVQREKTGSVKYTTGMIDNTLTVGHSGFRRPG